MSHLTLNFMMWSLVVQPPSTPCLLIVCLASALIRSMADSKTATDSKSQALQVLQSREEALRKHNKKTEFETAARAVRDLSLEILASQVVNAGKYSGKTCRTVYEEDPKYVGWLLNHQGENLRFINLLTYAQRRATEESPEPTKSSPPTAMSSGEPPNPRETSNGEATGTQPGPNLAMVEYLIETVNALKKQVEELYMAVQETQVQVYQARAAEVGMQNRMEAMEQRISELVEAMTQHRG